MKIKSVLLSSLALFPLSGLANPTTVITYDIYRAENDNGYGDVIGDNILDINRIEVTRDVDTETLSGQVFTNFAGQAGYFPSVTFNGKGVGYGDFLFGTYVPSNADTLTDLWGTIDISHAFILDDNWNNTGGNGKLYSIDNLSVLITDDLITGATFRNTVPVMVDRSDPDLPSATLLSTGTWSVNTGVLNFNINNFTIDPEVVYWTMGCGNDVAFGYVPEGGGGGQGGEEVPTPGTFYLLLAGLISMINKKSFNLI